MAKVKLHQINYSLWHLLLIQEDINTKIFLFMPRQRHEDVPLLRELSNLGMVSLKLLSRLCLWKHSNASWLSHVRLSSSAMVISSSSPPYQFIGVCWCTSEGNIPIICDGAILMVLVWMADRRSQSHAGHDQAEDQRKASVHLVVGPTR